MSISIKPELLCKYVNEFGKKWFKTDGKIMFCKACDDKVVVRNLYSTDSD